MSSQQSMFDHRRIESTPHRMVWILLITIEAFICRKLFTSALLCKLTQILFRKSLNSTQQQIRLLNRAKNNNFFLINKIPIEIRCASLGSKRNRNMFYLIHSTINRFFFCTCEENTNIQRSKSVFFYLSHKLYSVITTSAMNNNKMNNTCNMNHANEEAYKTSRLNSQQCVGGFFFIVVVEVVTGSAFVKRNEEI